MAVTGVGVGGVVICALLYHQSENVVFLIDRLKELQSEGVFGELATENYSFVGAASQKRLLMIAPKWAERLKTNEVDAALLVAA